MTISNDQALIQSRTVTWGLEIVRCGIWYLTGVYDDMQIMFQYISLHTFALLRIGCYDTPLGHLGIPVFKKTSKHIFGMPKCPRVVT